MATNVSVFVSVGETKEDGQVGASNMRVGQGETRKGEAIFAQRGGLTTIDANTPRDVFPHRFCLLLLRQKHLAKAAAAEHFEEGE